MEKLTILKSLEESVVKLEEEKVLQLVNETLREGRTPHEITESLGAAMKTIGEKFSRGDFFIPELIFGGQIFNKAMEIIKPSMKTEDLGRKLGKVVIGTVKGDLHDLGVTLVALTLSMEGFEVVNLGKDVPLERFIEKVRELKPVILGLSALLTTTLNQQREVIEALKAHHLRDTVKVMIGGAPVTKEWAETIGADAVGFDAIDALRKAKRLIGVES